jgi:hypothetical protein
MKKSWMMLALVFVTSCSAVGTSSTQGKATYVKPADKGGKPAAPQQKDDDLKLSVSIDAAGTFNAVDAALCALTSGDVTASVSTSGKVASDGSYVSDYQTAEATAGGKSPLCGTLQNVKLTSVTSVVVTASMPTNDTNCSAFCQAKADDQCSANADVAGCTASATASCSTSCKAGSKITGSGTASASAVADASNGAKSNGDVNATVDLVFTDVQ